VTEQASRWDQTPAETAEPGAGRPDPIGAMVRAEQRAAEAVVNVEQKAVEAVGAAKQRAGEAVTTARQQAAVAAAQTRQTAVDVETVFEGERERELARATTTAPDRQARVAERVVEPAVRREIREVVRARRRLPPDVERKIGWLAARDARLFLLVNGLPRTRALNRFFVALALVTNAGAAWIAVLGAMALANHSPAARRAFLSAAPTVFGTAWGVEGPIKGRVRRRRPFMTLAEAIVIGGRPRNWSWPSGHTASAFAAATIVARDFPQSARPLYAIAGLIGFSRIYLGAHFPSDVLSGAAIGTLAGLAAPPLLRSLVPPVARRLVAAWW